MRIQFLKVISVLGLLWILAHFTMVTISVAPANWSQPDLHYISDSYVKPQFFQYWQLFAPVPKERSRVFYKYLSDGEWSELISLEEEMSDINKGYMKRIALKSAHFLSVETRKSTEFDADGNKSYRAVKASYAYFNSAYICFQNAKKSYNVKPDSIALVLKRELTPRAGYTDVKHITDYYGAESVK